METNRNYTSALDQLKREKCTTKDEVIKLINEKQGKYGQKMAESSGQELPYYMLLSKHIETFEAMVRRSVLFEETPDWWFYYVDLNYDLFEVKLVHAKDYIEGEDGVFREKVDAIYTLVKYKPLSFTVESYAAIYGVDTGTVRQWIRRGKLRTAYKAGSEWRIPCLTKTPKRGYEWAQYLWNTDPMNQIDFDNEPEEYRFLKDYIMASFRQDSTDKSKFSVTFTSRRAYFYDEYGTNLVKEYNAKEREKLELYMISHPEIRYGARSF